VKQIEGYLTGKLKSVVHMEDCASHSDPTRIQRASLGRALAILSAAHFDALALGEKVGRLKVGLKADLIVLHRRDADVNQSLPKNDVQDVSSS
jgi:cytosine/adenosine deaminase-related metal-dependent hydrolase